MRSLMILVSAWLVFTVAAALFFLFDIQTFRPDLLAVYTFYVARTRPTSDAAVLVLFLGLLFAFFHHAAPLYFVLHAEAMVVLVRLSSRYVNLHHPFFVALFLFAVDMALQGLTWATAVATGPVSFGMQPTLIQKMLAVAGMTALIAPWIHMLLAKVELLLIDPRRDDVYLLK